MASLRGNRFGIEIEGDANDSSVPPSVVKDIIEKPEVQTMQVPNPPTPRNHSHGFPRHRNRIQSRFKPQKSTMVEAANVSPQSRAAPNLKCATAIDEVGEKRSINNENHQRLQHMSDDEIFQERNELFDSLDPSIIHFLMQRTRSSSGSASGASAFDPSDTTLESAQTLEAPIANLDAARMPHIQSATYVQSSLPIGVHFPRAPTPMLDQDSDTFFQGLHEQYFPFLPAEPEKLAWMKATADSAYAPARESVHLSTIRFDFRGCIVPPRKAATLPVTMGLHHHGDAPDSAGYTIPELAHLARSTFPMQRCMSFQTLGRVLFRLGSGGFGERDEKLSRALMAMVSECHVLETLREEVAKTFGHLSAKTYATEALWLWQRSGGRDFKAA